MTNETSEALMRPHASFRYGFHWKDGKRVPEVIVCWSCSTQQTFVRMSVDNLDAHEAEHRAGTHDACKEGEGPCHRVTPDA